MREKADTICDSAGPTFNTKPFVYRITETVVVVDWWACDVNDFFATNLYINPYYHSV